MDYGKVGTSTAVSGLAFTGAETLWYVIAAIALIMAGVAALRFVPKKQS